MGKKLIYLDTSFLSNFAKLEIGGFNIPSTDAWKAVLLSLRDAVSKSRLLCPASQYQIYEAQLDDRILPKFKQIQLELSKGIWFKEWDDILIYQTGEQLLIYFDRELDIDRSWEAVTDQRPLNIQVKEIRESKNKGLLFRKTLAIPANRTFKEQYELEKISFVQETLLQPLRQMLGKDTYIKSDYPLVDIGVTGLLARSMNGAGIPFNKLKEVCEFFDTDGVDRIDFIRIFCSVIASLSIYERGRKPNSSDIFDVPALASTIPYCDVVTTDKNMKKQILDRLRIQELKVFTPSPTDIEDFGKYCGSL